MANDENARPADSLSALEHFIQTWRKPLIRYVSRILHSEDAADDVVQEVLVKLANLWHTETFRPAEAKSWAYRVAHHRAIDYLRQNTRRKKLRDSAAEQMELDWGPPALVTDRDERMNVVLQEIQQLDERERQVLLLRLQEGLSYREIAEVMEEQEGTIGYLLHHAVKKMNVLLRQAGVIS